MSDITPKPTPPGPHEYPKDGEHLWGPWMIHTVRPLVKHYRKCVVPGCTSHQVKEMES